MLAIVTRKCSTLTQPLKLRSHVFLAVVEGDLKLEINKTSLDLGLKAKNFENSKKKLLEKSEILRKSSTWNYFKKVFPEN